jgi:hypothetical protein
MKKLLPRITVLVVALSAISPASIAEAQQPKLDIKALVGFSLNLYDSLKVPERLPGGELENTRERYPGWLGGFGARISKRKAFAEVLFTFNRFISDSRILNSFQLPINLGYIPFRIAEFGVFLYGGYVNHFNVAIKEGKNRTRIKNSDIVVYQALARFGVSFDLYMFNFDFNYSIGLNSATKTEWRTRYQLLQFTLAYVF